MTDDIRSVCREIARLKRERPGTTVRYPAGLRRRITALARECRARGRGGFSALARELGLPRWTLTLWARRSAPSPRRSPMRAVTVGPDPPAAAPTARGAVLVLAGGVRVEGASVAELATLLRALR
jgi:hypothetical protein